VAEVEARYRKKRLDRGIKARADTIFAIASYREILYLVLPRALPVILLFSLPFILTGYWGKVLVYACVYGLLALSWDFLAACGLFSLGQAFFLGIGAYIAGALSYYFHWSPVITLPIATIGGGVISAALLSPVVRLRGVYFAMVTLMLPMLFMKMIETTGLLGGTHGLSALKPFPKGWAGTYLVIGVFLVCLFIFRRIINEDYGLVLRAIRDDDRAVMSAAINIYWRKIQALFVAGAVGSFAGAFMTHHYQFVGMSAFAWTIRSYLLLQHFGSPGTLCSLGNDLVPLSEALLAAWEDENSDLLCYSILSVIALPEGFFITSKESTTSLKGW
jgi:branched-chain amino acid transport system permease protein